MIKTDMKIDGIEYSIPKKTFDLMKECDAGTIQLARERALRDNVPLREHLLILMHEKRKLDLFIIPSRTIGQAFYCGRELDDYAEPRDFAPRVEND